jgi:hypothetical protein
MADHIPDTGIAEYGTLDNHDGELVPSVAVREQVIRRIRQWNADVVLARGPTTTIQAFFSSTAGWLEETLANAQGLRAEHPQQAGLEMGLEEFARATSDALAGCTSMPWPWSFARYVSPSAGLPARLCVVPW